MAKVVADQRARGGKPGRPVLIVLVASLVLLGIYMVGLMTWSGSTIPAEPRPDLVAADRKPGEFKTNTSARAGRAIQPTPSKAEGAAGIRPEVQPRAK